jgi:hypothetical protein
MKRLLQAVLAAVVLTAAPAMAVAQQDPPPPPQDQASQPGAMTPGEVQKLFDAYIVVESQRALELTDAQYPQFIAKLRSLQDTRRRNQLDRNQLMMRLQRMTAPRAPAPDNATLEGLLKNLQELESRTAAETRKAYNELDQVLDIRQQARFRVLEEQVERRKIELLMRARQQNRPTRPQPKQQLQ